MPAIRWNSVIVRAGPSEIRVRTVWVRTSGPRTNAAPDAICVWTTKSIEALYWPPIEVQKSAFSSRGRPTDVSASASSAPPSSAPSTTSGGSRR